MLSNTFIVSEFVEILYSFPTWSCVKMCHAVPRPVPRTWQCVICRLHFSWYRKHIARWNTLVVVPYDILLGCTGRGTVWHISRWNTLVVVPYDIMPGTTTSASHLAMCHMVPRPALFTWQCVIRYHDQCLSPGSMSYGTTTVVYGHTLPGARHWSWYRMTHFNTWPRWKRIQNLHKFRNYNSIRQHLWICVDRKCKITYFYVTNNPAMI
jgi:hypothetical protein